jgi:SH3 domain protein
MVVKRAGAAEPSCRRRRAARAAALALCAPLLWSAAGAAASWVKGEVRLNLRTGPSNGHRIIGDIQTGDRVDVLELGEGWTRVRSGDREGWIPEGYLQDQPPASELLSAAQEKASELGGQVSALETQTARLGEENRALAERDAKQREELELLTRENLELKAGARWPDRIAGAAILVAGMLMGWVLHAVLARRQRPRIRL